MNELEQDLFFLKQQYELKKINYGMHTPKSKRELTELNNIKREYNQKVKEIASKMTDRELLEAIYRKLYE